MSANICQECGMVCTATEYHPYAACLMFKGCHDGDMVRANLAAIHTKEAAPSEEQMRKVLCEALETFSRYTCLNEIGQSNMEEEANEVIAKIEAVLGATQAPQEGGA